MKYLREDVDVLVRRCERLAIAGIRRDRGRPKKYRDLVLFDIMFPTKILSSY